MGQSPGHRLAGHRLAGHRLAAHSSQLLVMLGHDAYEHGTPQNTHPHPPSAGNHPLLIRSHSCCHSAEARGNKGTARQKGGWAGARCPRASVCGASGAFSQVGRSPDQNGALRSSGELQGPRQLTPLRWASLHSVGGVEDEPLPGGMLGRCI